MNNEYCFTLNIIQTVDNTEETDIE